MNEEKSQELLSQTLYKIYVDGNPSSHIKVAMREIALGTLKCQTDE
jgi:hypothetical protein